MPIHGVAVTVPDPWGPMLQQHRSDFGDPQAGSIPPHITLLPPTMLGEDVLEDFLEHLDEVAAATAPFDVVLNGSGTFRPVSPVVFVTVAKGISSCEQLERALRSGPVQRHLEFPYHPHVTVAHHLDDEALDTAFDALADFTCAFPVRAIELYHHDADGVWRAVSSHPLGGAAAG